MFTLMLLLISMIAMVIMSLGVTTGYPTKKFLAKVHDLEIEARKKFRDLLDTVHDRSSELDGQEESLEVPRFTPGEVLTMPIGDDDFVNGSIEDTLSIAIDDEKGYPIVVSESEALETNVALRDTRAKGGELAHRTYRQKLIAKQLADAAPAATNRLKFKDSVANVITDDDIVDIAAAMTNAHAPEDERYMVIGASMYKAVVKNANFISRDKMGQTGEVLPSNVIGKLRSFEVIQVADDIMPLLNASTGATASTGKKCVIFYQKYALAYVRHAYKLLGPTLDVGAAKTKWNLWAKQNAKGQNTTWAFTLREN